ncbi:hypothetical protein B0J13DRAFT_642178 [Dactylonectria estremocensis]|uniref:Uncharacterized protein n=1 Tax=Dactylonectria estremocensis TaxID=1079267 RepID=A0A9P9IUF5_9HYPO|nr:hypothetical protein B0J13DRAFT_642178 [Dactylonectria estremocensis]
MEGNKKPGLLDRIFNRVHPGGHARAESLPRGELPLIGSDALNNEKASSTIDLPQQEQGHGPRVNARNNSRPVTARGRREQPVAASDPIPIPIPRRIPEPENPFSIVSQARSVEMFRVGNPTQSYFGPLIQPRPFRSSRGRESTQRRPAAPLARVGVPPVQPSSSQVNDENAQYSGAQSLNIPGNDHFPDGEARLFNANWLQGPKSFKLLSVGGRDFFLPILLLINYSFWAFLRGGAVPADVSRELSRLDASVFAVLLEALVVSSGFIGTEAGLNLPLLLRALAMAIELKMDGEVTSLSLSIPRYIFRRIMYRNPWDPAEGALLPNEYFKYRSEEIYLSWGVLVKLQETRQHLVISCANLVNLFQQLPLPSDNFEAYWFTLFQQARYIDAPWANARYGTPANIADLVRRGGPDASGNGDSVPMDETLPPYVSFLNLSDSSDSVRAGTSARVEASVPRIEASVPRLSDLATRVEDFSIYHEPVRPEAGASSASENAISSAPVAPPASGPSVSIRRRPLPEDSPLARRSAARAAEISTGIPLNWSLSRLDPNVPHREAMVILARDDVESSSQNSSDGSTESTAVEERPPSGNFF